MSETTCMSRMEPKIMYDIARWNSFALDAEKRQRSPPVRAMNATYAFMYCACLSNGIK